MSHCKFTLVKEKRRKRKEHGNNKTRNHYHGRNLCAILGCANANSRNLHTRHRPRQHNRMELHRPFGSSLPMASNTPNNNRRRMPKFREGSDLVKPRYILSLSLFFLVLTLIIPVYAEDDEPDVNLLNLPEQLGNAWGISTFAAGIFMSTIMFFTFLFPLIIWRKSGLIVLIVGFGIMGFCIAVGWLPYWIMLLISLLIAAMYASTIKKMM